MHRKRNYTKTKHNKSKTAAVSFVDKQTIDKHNLTQLQIYQDKNITKIMAHCYVSLYEYRDESKEWFLLCKGPLFLCKRLDRM